MGGALALPLRPGFAQMRPALKEPCCTASALHSRQNTHKIQCLALWTSPFPTSLPTYMLTPAGNRGRVWWRAPPGSGS